jgi:hypothetical protein
MTSFLTPASEVGLAISSIASRLLPEFQPACLLLMETVMDSVNSGLVMYQ